MATFLVGLVILLVGGYLYGVFVERIFKPDDRKTPAVQMEDGIDYVPMSKWKNRTDFWTDSGNFVWTDCIYYNSDRMCD